jgi:hypothetical protein
MVLFLVRRRTLLLDRAGGLLVAPATIYAHPRPGKAGISRVSCLICNRSYSLRPSGHDRSMAAKRADGGRCGAARSGREFATAMGQSFQECMLARGWTLDHVIPDPPQTYVGGPSYSSPPVDNSSDDRAALQRDQDNLQQMINQQNQNNIQQQNMDQFDQQQQIINNNRLND